MRFLYSTANIFCLLFLWRQMQQHTVCYLMNACHSAFWLSCLAAATNTNTKDDVLCSVDYSCTTACHRPLFATAQGDNRPPWPFTVGFVVQQKLSKFATVILNFNPSCWVEVYLTLLCSVVHRKHIFVQDCSFFRQYVRRFKEKSGSYSFVPQSLRGCEIF